MVAKFSTDPTPPYTASDLNANAANFPGFLGHEVELRPLGSPPPYGWTANVASPSTMLVEQPVKPSPPRNSAPYVIGCREENCANYSIIFLAQRLGPNSSSVICTSCRHRVMTRVRTVASMSTHFLALLLCLVGCWPFVCLPYCIDSCQDVEHYCPDCKAFIGTYSY